MTSIVNGIDIEAWAADAILSGYGEVFAEAVVKAYEAPQSRTLCSTNRST